MGKIEASEAETHPAANVVLNAVGIDDSLNIDIEYFEIEHGDLFMLCSDGLYKDLSDDRISGILDQPDLPIETINQQLMDSALEQGGSDNCSVILVKAEKQGNGFR
jgi:serine/threonine protein phosphatase PrpC